MFVKGKIGMGRASEKRFNVVSFQISLNLKGLSDIGRLNKK